jgi:hypothetical protein
MSPGEPNDVIFPLAFSTAAAHDESGLIEESQGRRNFSRCDSPWQ